MTAGTHPARPRTSIAGFCALAALCAVGLAACGDSRNTETAETADATTAKPGIPGPGTPPANPSGDSPIGKSSGADMSQLSSGATTPQAMMGLPSSDVEPRSFRRLSPGDKEEFDKLAAEFHAATDIDRRVELLSQMEVFYSEELLAIVAEALRSPNEELRFTATGLLKGNISAEILDALRPALEDESHFVRIAALEAVSQVRDPAIVDFVARGFSDSTEPVRHAALLTTENMVDQNRHDILGQALNAPYADIAELAIAQFMVEGTPQALEAIFPGLDSPDPDIKREARFAVEWLIDQDFESTAAAQAWWSGHRKEFDNELIREEE